MKGWNSSLRHEHTHPSHILSQLPSSCPHTWSEIAQGPLSDGACTFPRARRAFPLPVPAWNRYGGLDPASLPPSLEAPALGHCCHDLRPSIQAWDGPLIWPVPQFPHLQVGSMLVLSMGGRARHTGLCSCSFAYCSRSALTQTHPPSLAGICGAWEGTALTLGGRHPFYTGHFQFLSHT